MTPHVRDVRFTSNSGHQTKLTQLCPLWVKSAHMIDEADDAPLLKLVAIQGNVWCAGHVIACTALHKIRLVRIPE